MGHWGEIFHPYKWLHLYALLIGTRESPLLEKARYITSKPLLGIKDKSCTRLSAKPVVYVLIDLKVCQPNEHLNKTRAAASSSSSSSSCCCCCCCWMSFFLCVFYQSSLVSKFPTCLPGVSSHHSSSRDPGGRDRDGSGGRSTGNPRDRRSSRGRQWMICLEIP